LSLAASSSALTSSSRAELKRQTAKRWRHVAEISRLRARSAARHFLEDRGAVSAPQQLPLHCSSSSTIHYGSTAHPQAIYVSAFVCGRKAMADVVEYRCDSQQGSTTTAAAAVADLSTCQAPCPPCCGILRTAAATCAHAAAAAPAPTAAAGLGCSNRG
jgi:hypothetical protein